MSASAFAKVIIPLPVHGTFSYRIPEELEGKVLPGSRVVVQFGKKKYYTGIVHSLTDTVDGLYQPKTIMELLDEVPVATPLMLQFWEWMSAYYMSPIGDVMNAALPAGFKLASETKVLLNPYLEDKPDLESLTDREYLILEALEGTPELTLKEIGDLLDGKSVFPTVKSLFQKGLVIMQEELLDRYKPKVEQTVSFAPEYNSEAALEALVNQMNRAPRQQDLVLRLYELSSHGRVVSRRELLLLCEGGEGALRSLSQKGIIQIKDQVSSRVNLLNQVQKAITLSPAQAQAAAGLKAALEHHKTSLLFGITGSGKTLVYAELVKEQLNKGKQVLYLLPEIGLTNQLVQRLGTYLGVPVMLFHSRFNEHERMELWHKVSSGEARVVIGVRSALFLPFNNLGLVVIDEEHETSFKQQESPRYQARDAATMLAGLHDAKVVLGSATPAFETWSNAEQGKYGLIRLAERFGPAILPSIEIVDIREEQKKNKNHGPFTSVLLEEIEATVAKGEQVILFQNRRGYAPMLECAACGWTPKCENCDISLTYHKYLNRLKCHYCGFSSPVYSMCPSCKSPQLEMHGYGTEKIEDELNQRLPDIKTARLDLETTRSKKGFQQILEGFEKQDIQVLIGTQMVTKGLDFENVTLVGIINADALLRFPDFRAHERSFQLMHQVAGRAGRREKPGKVLIQTREPEHYLFPFLQAQDYEGFYQAHILQRADFGYPPFTRLIRVTLKHKNEDTVREAGLRLGSSLQVRLGNRVLGPETPFVGKIQNLYIRQLLIKLERQASLPKVKEFVQEMIWKLLENPDFKSILVQPDVDPY